MRNVQKELAMKNSLSSFVLLLLAVALLAGCGAVRESHYYQLGGGKDGLRPAVGAEQFPVTILVSTFQTSHLYREDRIVYGSAREEMGLYQYQRWTEPPSEMLHDMIVRQLRGSGRYKEIYSFRSSTRGEFILRGHLYDLKEVSTGSGLVARVTFEAELVDAKTRNTLWTHPYTHDEPVASKDVAAVVAALNRNVQAGVTDLAASLEQYFAAHPSSPATASAATGETREN
jgi:ABC-type uncharacterized transport system auxiliary subunit